MARKLVLLTPNMISIGMKLMYGEAKILEILPNRFNRYLAHIMDFAPPFCTKTVIFVPILARKLVLLTPNIIPIGMKLMYDEAKILEIPS